MKISKTKNWFFENLNKISKLLTRLIKGRRKKKSEKIQPINIRSSGNNSLSISSKTYKTDQFLKRHRLSKLPQEEIDN